VSGAGASCSAGTSWIRTSCLCRCPGAPWAFTVSYAKSLYAATPHAQLADTQKRKMVHGLNDEQMALMERESSNLDCEFKLAEQAYGTDHLDLVLTNGYQAKLLGNARVVRYLAQNHQEFLTEFQRIAELESTAA
jgi:hypothetical protein